MGLDATVYCNCFEIGMLREQPPDPSLIYIAPDGSLEYKSDNMDVLLAFDQWQLKRACEHENGVLLHHRIGNVTSVELLFAELKREAEKFPVLLGKVLYSGTHAGDHLSLDDVSHVQAELELLADLGRSNEKTQLYVQDFSRQMNELVEAALLVRKPISF